MVGASGLLGGYLTSEARHRNIPVTATHYAHPRRDTVPLDIRQFDAVHRLIERGHPDWVLLSAYDPNVEACEFDPERTRRTNVDGVANVVAACRDTAANLVFYSSDYVFDGIAGPYVESDVPHPISEYGRQKAEAEAIVQRELPGRSLVLRITWVFGNEPQEKNFVARVVATLGAAQALFAPTDQWGNPTYAGDIAEATFDLIIAGATGLYHLAGPDIVSRAAFARQAAAMFNLDVSLVQGVPTSDLGQRAPRPLRAGLRTGRAEAILGRRLHTAIDGLRAMRTETSDDWR